MRIFKFAAAMLLVVAAFTASAAQPATPLQTDAIRGEQAQIKDGIDARTGAYKDLPASTREQLLAQQAIVLGLIEGKQSTGDLDASQKSKLFAALDAIDTMVNKASDERMVCQMRKTLGSNRNERVCRTAGQIREERETVRHQLGRTGMQGIQGN